MIRFPYLSYTIPSFKDIDSWSKHYRLSIVQATANMRQFPSRRNINDIISTQKQPVSIVIHYDYIYTISRWLFFTDSVREAILKELASFTDNRIIGVVMHADDPIGKVWDNVSPENYHQIVDSHYSSSIWNRKAILDSMQDNLNIFDESLKLFIKDYQIGPKIFLENTVKTPGGVCTLHNYISDKIGICFDTEHEFALTGNDSLIYGITLERSSLVHLNPVPKGVRPKSRIDRHSETTLYECSIYSEEQYQSLINIITAHKVPFVRECYQPTVDRELEQCKQK